MRRWGAPALAAVMALTTTTTLAACAPDDDDVGTGSGRLPTGPSATPLFPTESDPVEPEPAAHTFSADDCPWDSVTGEPWLPQVVQTTVTTEVPFLDDIPACAAPSQDRTWLHNRSTAVWTISRPSGSPVTLEPTTPTLEQWSFTEAVQLPPGTLLPGSAVTVHAPPSDVEWTIDIASSVAWEGHQTVVARLHSIGEDVAIEAMRNRTSPARFALVQCTLSVADLAGDDLTTADPATLVTGGLAGATTANRCQAAALQVSAADTVQPQQTLADDLARLETQTTALQRIRTNVSYAQRAARVVMLVLPR